MHQGCALARQTLPSLHDDIAVAGIVFDKPRRASDFFGRREIGKILGTITMIEIIGASVGGRITGYLADGSGGDYTHAFYGVTIAAAFAFLSTLAIFALAKDRKMNVVE